VSGPAFPLQHRSLPPAIHRELQDGVRIDGELPTVVLEPSLCLVRRIDTVNGAACLADLPAQRGNELMHRVGMPDAPSEGARPAEAHQSQPSEHASGPQTLWSEARHLVDVCRMLNDSGQMAAITSRMGGIAGHSSRMAETHGKEQMNERYV